MLAQVKLSQDHLLLKSSLSFSYSNILLKNNEYRLDDPSFYLKFKDTKEMFIREISNNYTKKDFRFLSLVEDP
jgi:hypothetical protein